MEIGFIGLGRMGKNMVLRLLKDEHRVVVWNRSPEPVEEVKKKGAIQAEDIEELVIKLNIFLNEEIFQNQLEPFIKLQFSTYDPELDEVCLIVDRDKNSFSKEQFEELKKNCRLNNFKLYLTNPCFEFWLLLHFDEVIEVDRIKLFENKKSKYKNNEGIFEEITYAEVFLRSIIPEYRKNDINFNLTKENLQLAIYNSKKFETDINKLKDSVGSNLGMLFEELINRKNS